jgi:hypothetical protein
MLKRLSVPNTNPQREWQPRLWRERQRNGRYRTNPQRDERRADIPTSFAQWTGEQSEDHNSRTSRRIE